MVFVFGSPCVLDWFLSKEAARMYGILWTWTRRTLAAGTLHSLPVDHAEHHKLQPCIPNEPLEFSPSRRAGMVRTHLPKDPEDTMYRQNPFLCRQLGYPWPQKIQPRGLHGKLLPLSTLHQKFALASISLSLWYSCSDKLVGTPFPLSRSCLRARDSLSCLQAQR